MSPGEPPLRATWIPKDAAFYSRDNGPWQVPNLDELLSVEQRANTNDSKSATKGDSFQVIAGGVRLDRDQLESLVAFVGGGLIDRGAQRGDAVLWQLPNTLASLVLYRACWRIGAVPSPVLYNVGVADREKAIDAVKPVVVIDLPLEKASDPYAIVAELGGTPISMGSVQVDPADIAVALFTSGSTGTPKAVLHTHRGLAWKAKLMARVHGLGRDDAVLMPAPLAHVSGLLNGILVPGVASMKTVLVSRFDPKEALETIGSESITFMAGPPTFFIAMRSVLEEDPSTYNIESLRLISSGGASVTPSFITSTSKAFSCRVKRTYGSTEAPTVTTSVTTDHEDIAANTDGRAVGEVQLRIVNPETLITSPVSQAGELWVKGPELFCGYSDPNATAEVIAEDSWFRTGDLAALDKDGWLSIVGRIKDVIIRGGENVSASEVESILEAHPHIRQAVAVGYPDPLMGERVCACVVLDGDFDLDRCKEWFVERGVAKFKTPERVLIFSDLPLLGSGKPDRAELARRAATTN